MRKSRRLKEIASKIILYRNFKDEDFVHLTNSYYYDLRLEIEEDIQKGYHPDEVDKCNYLVAERTLRERYVPPKDL